MAWLCIYLLEYESKALRKSELVECNRIYGRFEFDGLKWLSRYQRIHTTEEAWNGNIFAKIKSTKLKTYKSAV